jgi:predicted TIM-barrel fold metal-dependent hydrolase
MFTKAMLTAQSVMGQEAASSVFNQKKEAPSDFELGMGEMARAAKNPKVLAEALEMLKDPEVAAQVEAMMKDPKFVAEARKLSNNPNFKEAMSNAAEDIERLSKDPAVMSKLKAQML